MPDPLVAVRYHSLGFKPDSIPDALEVTAHSPGGIIQGIRHRELPVEGVQFHPESILTEVGKALLQNFLNKSAPVESAPAGA